MRASTCIVVVDLKKIKMKRTTPETAYSLRPLSAASRAVKKGLEKAFDKKSCAAVAISINSPGGSPAQSSLIYKRIRALASEEGLPVYTFAEDVAVGCQLPL